MKSIIKENGVTFKDLEKNILVDSKLHKAVPKSKHRIILDFNTWRKRFLLTMGMTLCNVRTAKKKYLFLELYHKHVQVSLAELYEKTMRKHGMRPRFRSA